jgi:hypothetical protein
MNLKETTSALPLAASKRGFRFPVPTEALGHFLHPVKAELGEPVWGDDAMLYASNGWVVLRMYSFCPQTPQGRPETYERLRKLHWHRKEYEQVDAWRKVDDCTLDLFREGVLEPWKMEPGNPAATYRWDPVCRINHGLLVPLVSMQLISRLPRCEIYTAGGRYKPLPFRFNGGEGLCALLKHDLEAMDFYEACHLFRTPNHKL